MAEKSARVRLKDVAEKAGVSAMAVSSALNGSGRISQEKAEYIRRLAQKMGYRTNVAAQILKRKKSGDIGLLILETAANIRANTALSGMTIVFSETCRRLGVRPQIEWFDFQAHPDQMPDLLFNGLVAGLLVYGYGNTQINDMLTHQMAIPFVRMLEPGEYAVYEDTTTEIASIVEYLIDMGHRRLALVNGPTGTGYHIFTSAKDAFLITGPKLKLDPKAMFYYEYADSPLEEYRFWAREIIRHKITAVIMHNASKAKALICELISLGVKVPDDVSFICFGAQDFNCEFNIPLTATDSDMMRIVSLAIKLLQERLENPSATTTSSIAVCPKIQERGSVRNLNS